MAALAAAVTAGIAFGLVRQNDEIARATGTSLAAQDVKTPRVVALWLGDSYTAGVGADNPASTAYPQQVCEAFNWVCNMDAQPGTGFVNDAPQAELSALPKRLDEDRQKFLADVIFVDTGRNDARTTAAENRAAVSSYFKRLRAAWPEAEIVAITPWIMNQSYVDPLVEIETKAAAKQGIHVLNPFAEGWSRPPGSADWMLPDGSHFKQPGHDWVAEHLIESLRASGISDAPVTEMPDSPGRTD